MNKNPDRVFRLVAGCNVTKLPLGAREGFLLSRIEGPTTIAELVAVTGFSVEDVEAIVDQLERLGALAASASLPRTHAVTVTRAPTPLPPTTAPPIRPSSDPRFVAQREQRSTGYSMTNVPAMRDPNARPIERAQTPTHWSGTRPAIDPMVARQSAHASLDDKARRALEEELLGKARNADDMQSWPDAAIAWLKLRELRPDDPAVTERAANALRRAGTDLHRAVRLAEEAVQRGPKRPQSRVTLALAYLDAKLFRRAQSELEEAVKLTPDDARVRKLLDQVRKMSA
jgi:predicted Zn-dependent protease